MSSRGRLFHVVELNGAARVDVPEAQQGAEDKAVIGRAAGVGVVHAIRKAVSWCISPSSTYGPFVPDITRCRTPRSSRSAAHDAHR